MKLLFCGDVVGKAGRKIVFEHLPILRDKLRLDAVIVNAENATHGFGISPNHYKEFIKRGTDVITLGNHSFDKKEIFPVLTEEENIIRPLNFPENTIGKGWCLFTTKTGVRIAVVQLMGRIYMKSVEDPFAVMSEWLKTHVKGRDYDVLFVDFHAEATAEKVAMGHFLDGKAGMVVGTHTHIPTADYRILANGTGYMTDVGMCGDYDSVIGMITEGALGRFLNPEQRGRLQPAENNQTFCAVFAEINEETGSCVRIHPVRIGAFLDETLPLV